MAPGRSTKIISMVKWIRTRRLSIKISLSSREPSRMQGRRGNATRARAPGACDSAPTTTAVSVHARPFVGVFQKSISIRFINLWRYFLTKTRKWLQERERGTPTKGLVWLFPLACSCRVFANAESACVHQRYGCWCGTHQRHAGYLETP